eukprot:6094503-Pyramimonas_sp.AAC.1
MESIGSHCAARAEFACDLSIRISRARAIGPNSQAGRVVDHRTDAKGRVVLKSAIRGKVYGGVHARGSARHLRVRHESCISGATGVREDVHDVLRGSSRGVSHGSRGGSRGNRDVRSRGGSRGGGGGSRGGSRILG